MIITLPVDTGFDVWCRAVFVAKHLIHSRNLILRRNDQGNHVCPVPHANDGSLTNISKKLFSSWDFEKTLCLWKNHPRCICIFCIDVCDSGRCSRSISWATAPHRRERTIFVVACSVSNSSKAVSVSPLHTPGYWYLSSLIGQPYFLLIGYRWISNTSDWVLVVKIFWS